MPIQAKRTGRRLGTGEIARLRSKASSITRSRYNGELTYAAMVFVSPHEYHRPSVPVNIQNTVLASVVNMLSGVSDYNSTRERARKRKIQSDAPQNGPETKKGRTDRSTNDEDGSATAHCRAESLLAAEPPILRSVVIGINEVTRKLEDIARSYRSTLCTDAQKATPSKPPPACSNLVIACRGDVDPPLLIGHLPNLIAACNSTRQRNATSGSRLPGTWLVPMSKGAENILAEATGLRRVSVLLVEVVMLIAISGVAD